MTQTLTRYCRILEIVGDLLKVEVRVGPAEDQAVARYGHLAVVENADGSRELFDVRADPREWVNLAAEPAHAADLARLQGLAADYKRQFRPQ